MVLLAASGGCGGASAPVQDYGEVGDFQFTERSGKVIEAKDLKGKAWLASFVFTRCTGPCPQVCATMAKLQEKLRDLADCQLVTFTVDPERDNPMELKNYADNFRADANRWWFLTGTEEALHQLIRQRFHLGVGKNPAEAAKPGAEFFHSSKIAVVDKVGRIRGFFEGTAATPDGFLLPDFEKNLGDLENLVRQLATEKP